MIAHYSVTRALTTPKKSEGVSLNDLVWHVVRETGQRYSDIVGNVRKREYVVARHFYYWLAWQYTRKSLNQIGKITGGVDHSSVIHGRDTIEDLLLTDKQIRMHAKYLKQKLSNRTIYRPIN